MAVVGGRMEAVAPRRTMFAPDYLRLAALAAVSVAVHSWLIGHAPVTARDGIGFARYAICLQTPRDANPPGVDPAKAIATSLDVVAVQQQAPGYPVAVALAAKFVRRTQGIPDLDAPRHAVQFLLAAQLVSAAAAVLLVVPTYLIGRMLFGRSVGFAAALLFQILPVPAHLTSDALSEGVYLLSAATALMFAVRAVRRPGVGGFLVCGLAVGASYLVRLEGLMVAAALGAVAGWLGLTRRWPRDQTLGRLTALGVGVALIAGPYVLLIGKLSNKPTANDAVPSLINPRQKLIEGNAGRGGPVVAAPLFAKWWTVPSEAGPVGVVGPAAAAALEETGKGLHYVGAGFALLGVFFLRRRVAAEPGLALLLTLAGTNLLVLVALGTTGYYVQGKHTFYVSERHTVLLVLIGCYFVAAALEPLAALLSSVPKVGRFWAGRFAPTGLLVALVVAALPTTLKPLHPHREGHKHAGAWLAANLREADCLIDPFEWAQWYSGRSLYRVPADPPRPEVTYAVLDDKDHDDDHARLPRMKDARNVAADGRAAVVYFWPEDGPEATAKVKVYRLVRPAAK